MGQTSVEPQEFGKYGDESGHANDRTARPDPFSPGSENRGP